MPRKCPPGIWCIKQNFVIGIVIILVIILAIIYYLKRPTTINSSKYRRELKQTKQSKQSKQSIQPTQIFNNVSGESRYSQAPEPLRYWQSTPDLRGALLPPGAIPINVSTRGIPQSFQQGGIIKVGEQILPLYGRQTGYRSNRYNYYTRTDSYNPVQLPVKYGRRNCMDDIGCDEILGGETVHISGIGKDGRVEVYNFDGPKYIPGIV